MKQILFILLLLPSLVSADIKINGVCIKEWNGVQVTQWNGVDVSCDDTPPTILSMTVDILGTDVAVVVTEAVTAGVDGFTSTWTIYYNDNLDGEVPLATLTYLSGTGSNTLHFAPSTTIPSNAHLLLSIGPITRGEYVQPGNGIKDIAGNLLATDGSITVTNNSTQ